MTTPRKRPSSPASLSLAACACTCALFFGCGSAPAPAATAPVHEARASTERCPAEASPAPADARTRMEGLKGDVLACFGIGTAPPRDGVVKVDITVDHAGQVDAARVVAEGAEPSALRCTEGALRKARFASFCGQDVPISWTYTLR